MLWIWFLNSIAVYITAHLLGGVEIKSFWTAIGVAAVLAVANTVIKPVLVVLSLPVTILTLGLFIFVIDALLVMLADKLIDGFVVQSFSWALLFAVIMVPVSYVLQKVFG